MSDLQWEPRDHRHNRSYSIAASTRSEVATRHSRFSWWQIMDQRARDRISIGDDARPSLDASSSDATHTRPETSTRTDASDDVASLFEPRINLHDDWSTPPTSAVPPSPRNLFPAAHIPCKSAASTGAFATFTGNLVNSQLPWGSQSALSPVNLLPLQQTRARKPDIRQNALARKSASSGMLYQTYQAEDLLVDRRDRLRSEVRALRHKTSLLDETLRQTVHQRLALHEERDAMSLASSSPIVPALDPKVTIMDRGRTVPRSDCSAADSVLWQASAPSAFGMAAKTNGQPKPKRPVLSLDIQAAQATMGVQRKPYQVRQNSNISIAPHIVSISKTRPTNATPRSADPALRRSTSLPAFTELPNRAQTSTMTKYDHKALRKTQNLYNKLTEGNTRGSASHKITGLWKNVRMRTR